MAPKRTRVTVEAVDGGTGGREGPYCMTFSAGSAPPELSCAVFNKPGASRHATLVGHTVRVFQISRRHRRRAVIASCRSRVYAALMPRASAAAMLHRHPHTGERDWIRVASAANLEC